MSRRRYDGPTHWTIVEREGTYPEQEIAGPSNTCRRCGTSGAGLVLHADPDTSDPRRTVCGECQGRANARLCRRAL